MRCQLPPWWRRSRRECRISVPAKRSDLDSPGPSRIACTVPASGGDAGGDARKRIAVVSGAINIDVVIGAAVIVDGDVSRPFLFVRRLDTGSHKRPWLHAHHMLIRHWSRSLPLSRVICNVAIVCASTHKTPAFDIGFGNGRNAGPCHHAVVKGKRAGAVDLLPHDGDPRRDPDRS